MIVCRNSIEIGSGTTVGPNVLIYDHDHDLQNQGSICSVPVSIGENVWIDNLVQVTIGSNVCISQGAMLLCGNHNYKLPTFDLIVKPIVIENGAWVGAKSTVCPGVTMSSHSVLSVGSVASKDLASYSVYRGNPATFVTKRIISES